MVILDVGWSNVVVLFSAFFKGSSYFYRFVTFVFLVYFISGLVKDLTLTKPNPNQI